MKAYIKAVTLSIALTLAWSASALGDGSSQQDTYKFHLTSVDPNGPSRDVVRYNTDNRSIPYVAVDCHFNTLEMMDENLNGIIFPVGAILPVKILSFGSKSKCDSAAHAISENMIKDHSADITIAADSQGTVQTISTAGSAQ